MRIHTLTATTVALLAGNAAAFPQYIDKLLDEATLEQVDVRKRAIGDSPQGFGALPAVPPPFNAKEQYVSNKGVHAFVPPGPGDHRGPCPGSYQVIVEQLVT